MRLFTVTESDWKQFMQADIKGLTQANTSAGKDATRTYELDGEVVAQMIVYGANTNTPGYECRRSFLMTEPTLEMIADIVVPILDDEDGE